MTKVRASAGALVVDQWSYIAVVYSDVLASAKVYVNGVLQKEVSSVRIKPLGTGGNVRVGGYKKYSYNGYLACLQIYHGALIQDEVLGNSNCSLREYRPFSFYLFFAAGFSHHVGSLV